MRKEATSTSPATKDRASTSRPPTHAPVTRRGPLNVSLASLRHPADPHRGLIDPERIVALAADIAINGLLQPIAIRGPAADLTYEIVYGDRRCYAHEHLKRSEIAAYIYPLDTDPLDIRASENLFNEPLDPIEEGRIAARYIAQGLPLAMVAAKMGHSHHWITERLRVLDYPPEIQDSIKSRSIPLSVAAVLIRIDHAGLRQTYLDEAARAGATARQAEVWVAHYIADGARMIANHQSIETIIREREDYRMHVTCEGCSESVDITQTQTLRFCAGCLAEVRKAAGA